MLTVQSEGGKNLMEVASSQETLSGVELAKPDQHTQLARF